MPIPDAHLAMECIRGPARYPVRVGREESLAVELGLFAYDHIGRIGNDPKDVPRGAASEAQPASLTTGEVGDPLMPAQYRSVTVDDSAGRGRAPLPVDEVADAAVGHETQFLRLGFVCIGHAQASSGLTDLRLD